MKKNKRRGTFSYKSNVYKEKSQRKIFKRVILLIALSVAFFFSFFLFNQNITNIQFLTEMKRVSEDDLRGISSKIYDEGFLQINLNDIKDEIEQVNWVKSVSLERRWPDQINILIEEEDIIGWWNKDSIINSKGNLFSLDQQSLPSGLIEFYGPDGHQAIVYEKYLLFAEELTTRGILIEKVTLDFKGSWIVTIRPNIALRLGKEDISERFDRFLMIWDESLLDNLTVIEYIDLRYTEGFSVKRRN
ncbi:FtsQ-type POTRA domain-containing protein [Gammaproteobacteria bacterium]|nr:FtsQ-type POTRA domain-containing protein [Gammaproteobacteria bacterium]